MRRWPEPRGESGAWSRALAAGGTPRLTASVGRAGGGPGNRLSGPCSAPAPAPRPRGDPPRLEDLLRACRGAFKSQDLELQTHLPTVEPVPGSSSFGISPLHFTMKTCQGPRPPPPRRVSLRVTPSLQVSTFQLEFPSGIITTFGICDSNSYFESSLGQLACG